MYLTAMMNAGDVLSIRYFGSCPPEITSTTTTSWRNHKLICIIIFKIYFPSI